jgi:hypothetical protein
MRILELPNKQTYEITEKEYNLVIKAGAQGSGAMVELSRLQIAFTTFGIFISPIPHQLEWGNSYLVMDKNNENKKWRVFLIKGLFICDLPGPGGLKNFGTKEELEKSGYRIQAEEEFLESRWEQKRLEAKEGQKNVKKLKALN